MPGYKPLVSWYVSRFVFMVLLLTLACSYAAYADTWSAGQLITYTQTDWGTGGIASAILADNFLTVYPTSVVTVGDTTGGFVMIFDNAGAISEYLPASGTPGPLDSNLLDPSSTSAGVFGGDVLALQLNVDFSAAGVILGSSGITLGDLLVENYSPIPSLNGLTVSQILTDAKIDLGGGTSPYTINQLNDLVATLDSAFDGGTPSPAAQEILVAPGGASGGGGGGTNVPEPSSALMLAAGLLGLGIFRYGRSGRALSCS